LLILIQIGIFCNEPFLDDLRDEYHLISPLKVEAERTPGLSSP
jgi:hypothetical protein